MTLENPEMLILRMVSSDNSKYGMIHRSVLSASDIFSDGKMTGNDLAIASKDFQGF